jgi:hypothetical protein
LGGCSPGLATALLILCQKTYRNKLAELYAGLAKDFGRLRVHAVAMGIDDLADANLADLDAAGQARTSVAVEDGAVADALAAGLEQGVLLGVNAEAGGQADARGVALVTARAAALGAVAKASRSAVVARADDAALAADEDAADAALHAIGALGGQRGQRHEVGVPAGPEPVRVGNVQLAERGVQVGERRRRVEQSDRGARDERLQARLNVVEMLVILRHKGVQGQIGAGAGGGAGGHVRLAGGSLLEAAPAHRQRRVYRDEQEERPADQHVEDSLGGNIRRHEAAPPPLGHKVEQGLGRREAVALGVRAQGQRRLGARLRAILGGEGGGGEGARKGPIWRCLLPRRGRAV